MDAQNLYQNGYQNEVGGMSEDAKPKEKGGVGAVIGSIIIILVLILGGLYFWGKEVSERQKEAGGIENATSSEDVSDIEKNLNSMEFNGIGGELDASLDVR